MINMASHLTNKTIMSTIPPSHTCLNVFCAVMVQQCEEKEEILVCDYGQGKKKKWTWLDCHGDGGGRKGGGG